MKRGQCMSMPAFFKDFECFAHGFQSLLYNKHTKTGFVKKTMITDTILKEMVYFLLP